MKTIITSILLMFAWYSSIQAQLNCNDLNATLNNFGQLTLYPEDLISGSSNGWTLSIDKSDFDCDDIGLNQVTLTGTNTNGTYTCVSNVTVADLVPPVPIANNNLDISLNANGFAVLEADMLDAGSYDVCTGVSFSYNPSVITCGMDNPVTVELIVTDDYGNSNSAVVLVNYIDKNQNVIVCNSDITVDIIPTQPFEVTKAMLYEQGNCISTLDLELQVNGIVRNNNTLYTTDVGKNVVGILTDDNNNSCWTNITVVSNGCGSRLQMSDINFPPDITIDLDCAFFEDVSPDALESAGYDSSDVYVTFGQIEDCLQPMVSYYDQVIFLGPGMKKILRTFTVIEWYHGDYFTQNQIIIVNSPNGIICDTLPWNTPFGDCASGHTADDLVEWPADVNLSEPKFLISMLENNPSVHPNDVRPILADLPCSESYEVVHVDQITTTTSLIIVSRTWTIYANSVFVGTYTQTLTAPSLAPDTYCVYRRTGEPIPNVELESGVFTDATGCAVYTGSSVLTPDKDSPAPAGIDIFDRVETYEHILGIKQLDRFQTIAADVSSTAGAVSSLDIVMSERMSLGLFVPDKVWTFWNMNAQPLSAGLPNNVIIGVKRGDVNDSYDLSNVGGNNLPEVSLSVQDQVLNKGELYTVTLKPKTKSDAIKVASLILNKNDNLLLKKLTTNLPEFDLTNHIENRDGMLIVKYSSKNGQLIPLKNDIVFTIIYEARANGILSEQFQLGTESQNLIEDDQGKAKLVLEWDDVIINKVDDEPITFLSISPNPTSDFITIEGYDEARYFITDLSGRVALDVDTRGNTIDVSTLQAGMYILNVESIDGRTESTKFVKL